MIHYLLVILTDESSCGFLPPFANGTITYERVMGENRARHDCNESLYIVGNFIRTCDNGTWVGDIGPCSKLLFFIPNGNNRL